MVDIIAELSTVATRSGPLQGQWMNALFGISQYLSISVQLDHSSAYMRIRGQHFRMKVEFCM